MILILKEPNKFIVCRRFKMDSLKTVTDPMTQACFMASVNIKDAYNTVSIATEHQKVLKFRRRNKLYQYTCLPNGLASAPRIFTKLLKPVFNILRQKGYCPHLTLMITIFKEQLMVNAMIMYKKRLCCLGILGSLFTMKNQYLYHVRSWPSWDLCLIQLQWLCNLLTVESKNWKMPASTLLTKKPAQFKMWQK